MQEEGISI